MCDKFFNIGACGDRRQTSQGADRHETNGACKSVFRRSEAPLFIPYVPHLPIAQSFHVRAYVNVIVLQWLIAPK